MDRDNKLYELERDILYQRKNEYIDLDVLAVELLALHQLSEMGDDYLLSVGFDDIREIGNDYEHNRFNNTMEINQAVVKIQEQIDKKFENIADEYFMQFEAENDYDYE